MLANLAEIALNLEPMGNGLWAARSDSRVSYPETGNDDCFSVEDISFWFRHRNECIIQAVQRFPPDGALFDIGGGNGYVAQALQRLGFEVVVVEPGPAGAANAIKRGVRHVVRSTLQDAGFRSNSLPAVGLFDVIEHIQDDRAFLIEISRLVIPGGRVYITVPSFQALWSLEDQEAGHWRRYNVKCLAELLRQCGYKVELATYIFSFLPLPIFLFRALPYRLNLARRETLESARAHHAPANRIVAGLFSVVTRRELSRIAAGKRYRFGGSCLIVASKA